MNFYVIGDVTVDHLYHLRNIPTAGETVTPMRSTMQPGGAGGTMSVTLARLGHHVSLAASVGDDPFAEVALKYVRESGVDLSTVQNIPELLTSTITVMQTPDGMRAMITSGEANRQLDAAKLKKKDIENADALLISAYSLIGGPQREYAIKAMGYAKKASVPVIIDLGAGAVNTAGTRLLDTVMAADYLLLNQHELQTITETDNISDALNGLKEKGMPCVVVKVGAHGSIVWTPEHTELVEPTELHDEVIDSTGAGDTFTAVFAHAVLSGLNVVKAAKMANHAGAMAATAVGAQRKIITLEELQAALL